MPPCRMRARGGLRGCTRPRVEKSRAAAASVLGSGALRTRRSRRSKSGGAVHVAADVWSVTSYQELYRDGHAVDRWNRLHPDEKPRVPYVTQCLAGTEGVIVAASDYVKALPDAIDRWLPRPLTSLGTDGFGRSEGRAALRDFFAVDAKSIAYAALAALAKDGTIQPSVLKRRSRILASIRTSPIAASCRSLCPNSTS